MQPELTLSDADRRHVEEIVRRLDGLPLAIELAAARVNVLSVAEISERLAQRFVLSGPDQAPRAPSERFDLLTSQERGRSERQRTLRGALEWSWQLLSEVERSALAQCSLFQGAFPVQAAEVVVDLGGHRVLDALQALRDKSLLRSVRATSGDRWLGMYESVRELAREKLGDDRACAARYVAHFSAPMELGRLIALRDDVMAAHATALELGDFRAAARAAIGMERLMLDHGPHVQFERMVRACIAFADQLDDRERASLYLSQSFLRMLVTDRVAAVQWARRAADIAARLGEARLELRALQVIGQISAALGDDANFDLA